MEKRYMVLTAVGPDRPGIVKDISAVIHECGCNLEDSRMALLAGEFALVLLFSGAPDQVSAFSDACSGLGKKLGFRMQLTETSAPVVVDESSRTYGLRIAGVDQQGIVHRVTEVLANNKINVSSMESRVGNAAFTGTTIFTLQAELVFPNDGLRTHVEEKLNQVCEELQLSCALEPLDG